MHGMQNLQRRATLASATSLAYRTPAVADRVPANDLHWIVEIVENILRTLQRRESAWVPVALGRLTEA